jgi:NAD(P)-dependent dehydrogenase (short-subunit alcohol dehydrogenase family)
MEDLEGRVAVITGGASGIGLAMAERFAAEGMRLVLADIERPVLQRAGEALKRGGAEVLTVPTDVSIEADVAALAATSLEHFGDVHLVCNNAGVGSRGLPIAELPLEDFAWVLAVNLFGVIHGLRVFLPHLRANDVGHIVNTASTSGLYHLPRMGPYNASKAAVVALSETLRFELAAEGSKVGVSVLCPSWVRTNIATADRNRPERFAYSLDTGCHRSPPTPPPSPTRCARPSGPIASTSSPTPPAWTSSTPGHAASSPGTSRWNRQNDRRVMVLPTELSKESAS